MFYIDPGTGSMLFTLALGVFSVLWFGIKGIFMKLKYLNLKKEKENSHTIPLVIFSDDKRYWQFFEPICRELDQRGFDTVYMTESEDDPVFQCGLPHIQGKYIGSGNMAYGKLNFLNATMVLSTTPGLDVYQWKRSKDVKQYIYIPHGANAMTSLRMFSLDFFDSILVSGQYQIDLTRKLEALRNEPEKELILAGVPYMDEMLSKLERTPPPEKDGITVLLAPSWGKSSVLKRFGSSIIQKLLETGYHVIIRPHPQSFVSETEMIEQIMHDHPASEQLEWNRDVDNFDVLNRSDILISDYSGTIFEFAFAFDKPVICVDTDFDDSQYDVYWLDEPPWAISALPKLGRILKKEDLPQIKDIIDECLTDERYKIMRQQLSEEAWANKKEGTVRVVDHLEKKYRELVEQEEAPKIEQEEQNPTPHPSENAVKKERPWPFRNFDKRNVFSSFAISFLLAAFFGLLDPFDVMLVNARDFYVSWSDALSCLWLPTFLAFGTLLLLLLLALVIHRWAFEILRSILLGVTVASYCQELFLNGKMVLGDNGTILGEITDIELSVNIMIHFAILAVFVILSVSRLMKSRTETPSEQNTSGNSGLLSRNYMVYALFIMTLMKGVGLVPTMTEVMKNDQPDQTEAPFPIRFYSYEPTVSYSGSQNNIYVFIVDTLDTLWSDELLEIYPELTEELEGFTFYQNNTSCFGNTLTSVTQMLTDHPYTLENNPQYIEEAWQGENTFTILKDNDYRINMILDQQYLETFSELESVCDNLAQPDSLNVELDVPVLRRILYDLSFSRLAPYAVKGMIPNEVSSVSNVEYLIISSAEPEKYTQDVVSESSDLHLFEYARTADFNADCDQGVFTIIHMAGAHGYNDALAAEAGFSEGERRYTTIRANFETILYYIRAAKQLGVYDNTTFIILGDHGRRSRDVRGEDYELLQATQPALFIKPANAGNVPLQYDRDTGLSNSMFMASVLEYAGIPHQEYGASYQDVIDSQKVCPREFYWNEFDSKRRVHYIIEGDARDFSNWSLVSDD